MLAWFCYALLIAAWIADLMTPQLLIVAILFNAPIALSSLALRSRLTTNLVIAAEIANALTGYLNGAQSGRHWDGVAIGDRLLLAASFVLVGYLSIKTQEYAREAGVSTARMRQVEIEKALRGATGRVRETLNVELVRRAVTREAVALMNATKATLIVRDSRFGPSLMFSYARGDSDVYVFRAALSAEMASLVARAEESDDVVSVTPNGLLGRLMLEAFDAGGALATRITAAAGTDHVLIASVVSGETFVADAHQTMHAFAQQAAIALDQAFLFTQLGERNDEVARQRSELADRTDVIRDIVFALAHDLRTPLAAGHVTMTQALAGSYGDLPERYREILKTTLGANDDERRIVETLLLVARYESGEASTVRELIDCGEIVARIVAELEPIAETRGVGLWAEPPNGRIAAVGDPHEIRRAIANLLANAIDATPRGGRIVVGARRAGDAVAIRVEDDGYGVPEERRNGLFQRFGGGRPSSGSGLGLYIVRRIAEKHGGTIAYAPREPQGSAFTLTLPMAQV